MLAISIIIDILFLSVFALIVFFFTKFGLDRALLRIGRKWLSLACALIIGPSITNLLERWFLTDGITSAVHKSLVTVIDHNANGYNLKELFEQLPQGFVKFLDGLGASLSALEAEFGSYTEAGDEIIFAMAERIATPCVNLISSIIGMVLGFVIPWLFMKWLTYEIEKDEIPFFRVLDRIGGFLVGAAAGYTVLLGVCLLVRTIFQITVAIDASVTVMDIYYNSFIFRFIGEFDTIGMIKRLIQAISDML